MGAYSVHVAGLDKKNEKKQKAFSDGAEQMRAMCQGRGFTAQRVAPNPVDIEGAVADIAGRLGADGGGTFLLTYTGHGASDMLCPGLPKGQTWMLDDIVDYHELSIWRLLVGKFAAGTKVVVMSDSCYSTLLGYKDLKRTLLRAYMRRVGDVGADKLSQVLAEDGLEMLVDSLRINVDVCALTLAAPEPVSEYLHISAGEGIVEAAALTRAVCSVLADDPAPALTYEGLRQKLLLRIAGIHLKGPESLMQAAAFRP